MPRPAWVAVAVSIILNAMHSWGIGYPHLHVNDTNGVAFVMLRSVLAEQLQLPHMPNVKGHSSDMCRTCDAAAA
jgi:hypothetical protein